LSAARKGENPVRRGRGLARDPRLRHGASQTCCAIAGLIPRSTRAFAWGMGIDRIAMLKYGMPDSTRLSSRPTCAGSPITASAPLDLPDARRRIEAHERAMVCTTVAARHRRVPPLPLCGGGLGRGPAASRPRVTQQTPSKPKWRVSPRMRSARHAHCGRPPPPYPPPQAGSESKVKVRSRPDEVSPSPG